MAVIYSHSHTERGLERTGVLTVGKKEYSFSQVNDYHFDYDEDTMEPVATIASNVGLVDDDGKGYCTLVLDDEGAIESFYYDFDDDGEPYGDDISFDPNERILIYP